MNSPWMSFLDPLPIAETALTLFHDPVYLRLLKEASWGNVRLEMLERSLGTDDNPLLRGDRKSTRLNSSHTVISYAVFCLKK